MRIGEQECHFQQLACRGWVLAGTRREVIADAAETTVLKVAQLIHKARLQCACRLRRLASCKGVEPSVARLRAQAIEWRRRANTNELTQIAKRGEVMAALHRRREI